jgi:hypothetical protein
MKRLALLAFVAACTSVPPTTPTTPTSSFYSKHIQLGGISIMGHASVSDEALGLARDRLERMLAHAPRIRRNLEQNHFEIHVSGLRQLPSDVPEFRQRKGERLANGELFDEHMIGGHVVAYTTVCTEATLIGVVGHRLYGNDSCPHELGHGIELTALAPRVRERLVVAWEHARADRRWGDDYAGTSPPELFAEATRFYVGDRAFLERRDPETFALVRDLYGDAIDPGDAPREESLRPGPAEDEPRLRSAGTKTPVRVRVRNGTARDLRVQWIDFEGKRDRPDPERTPRAHANGDIVELSTFVRHAFVVIDMDGRAVATFVAPESDALVSLP